MSRQIYVNLPVADLARTVAFFTALGFSFNPQMSNDDATCMLIGDGSHVMLLTTPFFASFTGKPVADAHAVTEVLVCLSADSRDEVDALVRKAVAAGGSAPRPPQDHGFMYGHGFEDLDGHVWELVYMDLDAAPAR